MNLITLYDKVRIFLYGLRDLPLLTLRLILCYGFYEPAMMKIKNIESVAEWFASLGLPMPILQAYMAAYTELSGVVLLALGLGTRLISIPLTIVMIVAISTVHWVNGFAASDNGFEIPLYYMLMLATLMVFGGGRVSLDYLIRLKTGVNK